MKSNLRFLKMKKDLDSKVNKWIIVIVLKIDVSYIDKKNNSLLNKQNWAFKSNNKWNNNKYKKIKTYSIYRMWKKLDNKEI